MFVVTGGGSGIGRALAHALAERGQSVLIVGRHEDRLRKAAVFSPFIKYLCADVATDAGRAHILSHLQTSTNLDGLVHNAGTIEPITPVSRIDETSWRRVLATNLDAPLFLTQSLQNKLQSGRVLHIGSGAAYFPITGWSAYCVSKAALSMLTRCWQLECPQMAVASVMPGIIDTPMQAHIRAATDMDADKQAFFRRLYQEHHLLSPTTVAHFLCWLLLDIDKAEYVSKEWDIYDETHHHAWLKPPFTVPPLE